MHSLGLPHGDLHAGNIMYDVATKTISILDVGANTTTANDAEEFGLADVRALSQIFASAVCVPPIPYYTEMLDKVSSVREMLAMLSSFPLLPGPTLLELDESFFSTHADQRYIRMSEWIHRFRREFDIRARIAFNYERTSDASVEIHFDQASQRVTILCGSSYDLTNEFGTFCHELIRIFARTWAQSQFTTPDHKSYSKYVDLERGDRSLQIGEGRPPTPEQVACFT